MRTFVIGRDTGGQIVLNDKLVSRRHAELTFLDTGQVIIKDLGSSNGTFVNGNRVTECYLNDGDIVKCGSLFLNWAQYIDSGNASAQPMNYQQLDTNPVILQESNSVDSINQYNLGDIFTYLTTRIFEIGDLFKTNWNRTTSILFLKGVPVIFALIVSIIVFSKYDSKFYFSPTISAVLFYAVSPFITIYLLSLNKKVQIDKVALASGVIGFIQFSMALFILVYFWIFYPNFSADYRNTFTSSSPGFYFFVLGTVLLLVILLVNSIIAFYLFIYKYFISIGVSRSKSIYLIIVTSVLDIFFKVSSVYIIYLIVGKSIDRF